MSMTVPASTAIPMTISSPTTTFAASGPSGAGPLRECECPCECATANTLEVVRIDRGDYF